MLKLEDVKVGDVLTADAGFTCMPAGQHEVKIDDTGLYVECDHGKHYLDGQKMGDGTLDGLE
mgnify:CR=1 FL=1